MWSAVEETGLNPRLVGQVFRLDVNAKTLDGLSLNPRLVGQVFRQNYKSQEVLDAESLNPRLVGQVFRL